MASIRRKLDSYFGEDSLRWIDRAYIVDWVLVSSLWILSWIASAAPVFERDFSNKDKLISHPHKHSQISGFLNHILSLYVPIALVLVAGLFRRSLVDIHHGIIAVSAGRGLTRLVTEVLKSRVGRLRPDFLARCKWDKVLEACTGKADKILDGRRSFPSGHSSGAFAGCTFLALWLAGQTAAWCFNTALPPASVLSSRMARTLLTLSPIFWAMYVAVTRLEDYRHHKEDVIAGAVIGIVSSTTCYLIYWPSPFFEKSFSHGQTITEARSLYAHDRPRNAEFELTSLDEVEGNV